jgi:hypothetical protein
VAALRSRERLADRSRLLFGLYAANFGAGQRPSKNRSGRLATNVVVLPGVLSVTPTNRGARRFAFPSGARSSSAVPRGVASGVLSAGRAAEAGP